MKNDFKSAICTSREYSERLLALGLKKETADMALVPLMEWDDCTAQEYFTGIYVARTKEDVEKYNLDYIPAWSLHRLMILAEMKGTAFLDLDTAYEITISIIATKIRFGYFNKEYLENGNC